MLHWLLKQAYKIRHKNTVNILIYHQVLDKPDPMRPSEPTTEIFDWQMKLLSQYFNPISLDQAVDGLTNNSLPDNAVVVTFDDGYVNNLTQAQPILENYKVPATFYIATGFSHGANMWNDRIIHLFADSNRSSLILDDDLIQLGDDNGRRQQAYARLKQLKYFDYNERIETVDRWYKQNQAEEQAPLMMTPKQVSELSRCYGATIGAHTINHPILKEHSPLIQKEEMLTSKQSLEEWIDKPVKHFAYPNGSWHRDLDETTVSLAKECGFDSAVITNWGKCHSCTEHHLLPRFTPWDKSELKFHLRMMQDLKQN